MRILTVEDDASTAKLVRILLEHKLEASVDTAQDCSSARELLSRNSYDLITLDYQLPDGDGLSLLEEIVGKEQAPPVVMVTGHGDERTAVSAFKLGASGYVVKDARMSTLLVEEARSALARAGQARAEEDLETSEERYRNVVANTKNGVAVYKAARGGEDFVFTDFNKAAEVIDGVSREDVVGRSVLQVFPGVREFGLFEVFQRVWRTGVPERFPVSLYTDERITGWRDNYVYKLSSGELVTVYEDVTERKQAEEALLEREARLKSITQGALDAILLIDSKLIISHWNPAAEKLYGFTAEEAEDQSVEIIFPEPRRKAYRSALEEFIHTGQRTFTAETPSEMLFIGKNKTEFPVEVSASRLQIGDEWFAEVIARDISERKMSEEALRIQYGLVTSLGVARDLGDAYERALDAVLMLESIDSGGIYAVDPDSGAIDLTAHRGLSDGFIEAVSHYDADSERSLATVLRAGECVYGRYEEAISDVDETRGREGLRATALAPITHEDRLVAALVLASHTNDEISERDKQLIEVLAFQLGSLLLEKAAEEALRRSEERYERVVESIRDALIITDAGFIISGWNNAAIEIYGYTAEEAAGQSVRDLLATQYEGTTSEEAQLELADKGHYRCEVLQRRKDGTQLSIEALVISLENAEGGIDGYVAVNRDITERKRPEEALRRARALLEETGRTARVGGWECDVTTRDQIWTAETYRIHELEPGIVPTVENGISFYSPEAQPVIREAVRRAIDDGESFDVELPFITARGNHLWVHAIGRARQEDDGTRKVYGTFQDITERKMYEEALKRANAELSGYAHIVSHDLKGPLSSIKTAADILTQILEKERTGVADGRAEEALRLIREISVRAVSLTDNLLALAHAGQAPAKPEPVDISGVVRFVCLEKEALFEQRGVRVSLDENLGVTAMDETHAYQVFSNLIGNAIEHNEGPEPQVEVRLLSAEAPGTLRYLVRDNGPGIASGDMDRVFLPFQRGAGSRGTGIGLSIVDKVVRLYGGGIRAYNDSGACFEFTLPQYSSQNP